MKVKQKKGTVKFSVPFVVELTGEVITKMDVVNAVESAQRAISAAVKVPKRVKIEGAKVFIG